MNSRVRVEDAEENLPDLADKAATGETFVIARQGRELAVIIGIDEYKWLKELEDQQQEADWAILLAPPTPAQLELSEEEADEIAIRATRDVRSMRRSQHV